MLARFCGDISVFFLCIFMIFDILEHLGAQGPQGEKTSAQNSLDLVWIWARVGVMLGTFCYFLGCNVLMFFACPSGQGRGGVLVPT